MNLPDGKTALILAVERGDVEGVKILVLSGAKVDVKDKDGDTALSAAKSMLRTATDTQKALGEIVPVLQRAQPKSKP